MDYYTLHVACNLCSGHYKFNVICKSRDGTKSYISNSGTTNLGEHYLKCKDLSPAIQSVALKIMPEPVKKLLIKQILLCAAEDMRSFKLFVGK